MIELALDWEALWPPVALSLQVTLLSSVVVTVLGVAAAWLMSAFKFRGKTLIETALMLPLVLPPTVVGFILLILLGRRSAIGQFIEWLFSAPVVFTWWAAAIASITVAFPLVYQTMKTGFDSLDRELLQSARSAGANGWQLFRFIALPLASRSLLTAYILGFARGLGEFGATLMIAGNIPGRTQTVPTAIYVAVDSGNMPMAWAWTICTTIISFLLLYLARKG
ncbi:molybdate ABC transporter permease subunit [Paenibacillus sp. NPDC058071]|uniref:molybdate ABC transporter permease subunit n=1 Tax=Paenibacillus sp. NPDC058071 TaxID=3346326 RepID=UPI0036DF62A0